MHVQNLPEANTLRSHRLVVLSLLTCTGAAFAQQPGPAGSSEQISDVQANALMQKAQGGQRLTPKETKQLQEHMMLQAFGGASAATGDAGVGASPMQNILQNAQSGKGASAVDQQALRDWARQQGAAMKQQGQDRGNALPPDVKSALQKKKSGQPLSADEQKAVDGYISQQVYQRGPGGAGGGGMGALMADVTPIAKNGAHWTQRPKLKKADYVALAQQVVSETSQLMGVELTSQLDTAMGNAPLLKALAPLLVLSSGVPAPPGYVLAQQALKNPTDALVASNFGVALYNANYFERAWDVLTYADGLHPDSPTVISNRAYAALYGGDLETAQSLFGLVTKPGFMVPEGHLGMALLGKAKGDKQMYMMASAQAMASGSNSFVDQAFQGEGTAGEDEDQRAQDTPLVDQPGFGGSMVWDVGGGSDFEFPTWTVPPNAADALAYVPAWSQAVQKTADIVTKLTPKIKAAAEAVAAKGQPPQSGSGDIYVPRRNPRMLIMLGDLNAIYRARAQKKLKKWTEAFDKGVKQFNAEVLSISDGERLDLSQCPTDSDAAYQACAKQVGYKYCIRKQNDGKQFHAAWGQAYGEMVAPVRDLMNDYWKKSSPLVEGLADPDIQKWQDLQRQGFVNTTLLQTRTHVPSWVYMLGPMIITDCGPPPRPPDAAKEAEIKKDAKTPDSKPGKCQPQPGSQGLGPVKLSWTCDGFKLSAGAGVFGSVAVKFPGANGKGTLSGHTETTLSAGVGDQLSVGKASGSASATISITQSQGQVVDVGGQFQTQAGAKGYGSSIGAEMDTSWSMRSGSNMSASGDASWNGTQLAGFKF